MENLSGGAPYTNKVDQEAADPQNGGGFLTNCAGASVGLAFGFAGLIMGATSVVGAGFGAAAFIYTSAQWGAACR
ncbi:hypothetical protein SOM12_15650 [Flavobacterium sp. CFBP9031]|uniref:hypothetical protein n=1 Tax=Flavobacterium sp. CFBP9031 TaxID=3096538 RepID=UPI002A6B8940|nr:hypothetical protein [Flavobacterium sp. CFBP9031]MDY0988867.1 hypothetical protein [Flavobacterium sp. CFBP9031]